MFGYSFGDSYSINQNGTDYIVYSTVSKKLAEDLQEILLKCGILCNISTNKTRGNKPIYSISVGKEVKSKRIFYKNKKKNFYSGMVYCITLNKTSVFLTKRSGKICFTGNCKTDVFERLFEIDKPFAMLVGCLGVFESKRRYNIFSKNKFEVMNFDKRISFIGADREVKVNTPFSSIYICHNILPKQIMFREIDKTNV